MVQWVMHAWHGIGHILVGVVEEVEVDELLDLERLRGDVLDDLAAFVCGAVQCRLCIFFRGYILQLELRGELN